VPEHVRVRLKAELGRNPQAAPLSCGRGRDS
jgi:hypothetical protein